MKLLYGNPLTFPRGFPLPAWILVWGTTLALAFKVGAQPSLEAPFTRITSGPIATDAVSSLSAAWGDPDHDGWLDLFVGNQWTPPTTNFLYRNNRDGTFSRLDSHGEFTDPAESSHASAWMDYDNDGWQDLFVVNPLSSTGNYLYRNTGDGGFARMSAAQVGPIASDHGRPIPPPGRS